MKRNPYILWLASWYPNKVDPFVGDFIQRHARALSLFTPAVVFYVSQAGIDYEVNTDLYDEKKNGNLTEITIFFKFKRTGIKIVDKVIYNILYYKTYKRAIKKYFDENGMPQAVHVHVPLKAGMVALWIKKRLGIPYFLTEHSTHYGTGTNDDILKKSSVYRNKVARIFRNSQKVTNVSKTMGKRISEMFGLPAADVINNTVDETIFSYDGNAAVPFRFIHVSTLNDEQKNIQGILRSVIGLARRRKDFEFIIVGPATEDLHASVKTSGLEQFVSFTGEIPYERVAIEMKRASAFVLFSRYENSPCVIGESLCSGVPVISSDVGGISEIVNETNGILVRQGNEEQLTEAMEKMIDNYSIFDRRSIAIDAKLKFSFTAIGKKIYQLYSESEITH